MPKYPRKASMDSLSIILHAVYSPPRTEEKESTHDMHPNCEKPPNKEAKRKRRLTFIKEGSCRAETARFLPSLQPPPALVSMWFLLLSLLLVSNPLSLSLSFWSGDQASSVDQLGDAKCGQTRVPLGQWGVPSKRGNCCTVAVSNDVADKVERREQGIMMEECGEREFYF